MAQISIHQIEDDARWVDPESPEYFVLMQEYSRALNSEWQKKISAEDAIIHDARRPHPATGPDPFRARTIARKAINELEYALVHYDEERAKWLAEMGLKNGRQRKSKGEAHELARKAAHAVRKIRPDLFTEG